MSPLALLAQLLGIAVPYLLAAAGGTLAERAGVVSLTLQGFLLSGAFGAVMGAYLGHSVLLGVLCGLLAGVAVASLHALACIRFGADQIVAGVALNLLVGGLTRFFLQLVFDSSSNSPQVAGLDSSWGYIVLALAALPLLSLVLQRTQFGLRVRAVGEHPTAAASLGVPVARVRWWAVLGSGGLAGLGGAYLSLDQHQFVANMTGQRGYIALAAVIFGRWQPLRVGAACLLFAAAETLQTQLKGAEAVPSQVVEMIPYVLTIVAVAGVVGRSTPPASLGKA
jgi:simple sugar transport system permease protein